MCEFVYVCVGLVVRLMQIGVKMGRFGALLEVSETTLAKMETATVSVLAMCWTAPTLEFPEGPKIKNIRDFGARLKISSEIFERTTHRGPIFCGEFETSRLKF